MVRNARHGTFESGDCSQTARPNRTRLVELLAISSSHTNKGSIENIIELRSELDNSNKWQMKKKRGAAEDK